MTHPLLTRAHLEATLVATAAVRHDLAPWILARLDRSRVSWEAWDLVDQIADPATDFNRERGDVYYESKAQSALGDRVDRITVDDLTFWPLELLVALVNQLPARTAAAPREQAWERDLARAQESAA